MKCFRMIFMCVAAAVTAACSDVDDGARVLEEGFGEGREYRIVTFAVDGGRAATRGSLTADGKQMTDLWVIDYVDGSPDQQLHQVSTDADFGAPRLALTYGSHSIYFIASRGTGPTLSTDAHTITWEKPSDSFYCALSLNVTSATSTSQTVTLSRAVTKLHIAVTDEVPAALAKMTVTPAHWYYGMDYLTGYGTNDQTLPRPLTIPSSYIGTTGRLNLSIFGFVPSGGFSSDISISATDASEGSVGEATVTGAAFAVNRATSLSGMLFSGGGLMDASLDAEWQDELTDFW